MHRMIGFMTGSAVCYGIWLGDELGLYRVLADGGPAPRRKSLPGPAAIRGWSQTGSTVRPPAD